MTDAAKKTLDVETRWSGDFIGHLTEVVSVDEEVQHIPRTRPRVLTIQRAPPKGAAYEVQFSSDPVGVGLAFKKGHERELVATENVFLSFNGKCKELPVVLKLTAVEVRHDRVEQASLQVTSTGNAANIVAFGYMRRL